MKKLLLFLLVCLFTHHVTAQKIANQPYDFPVKPGTEEWTQLESWQARRDVCQIPENVLNALSTRALVETCMKYPLFGEFIFFNDKQKAIIQQMENFNGLKELSLRADRVEELLAVYENMQLETEVVYRDTLPNNSTIHFEYIELLLNNDVFMQGAPTETLLALKQITLEKYEQKIQYPEIYGTHSLRITLSAAAKAHAKIENLQDDEAALNTAEEMESLYNQLKN